MEVVVSEWLGEEVDDFRESSPHISPPFPIRTERRVPGRRGVGWDVGIASLQAFHYYAAW